jgi:hypothetical protein
MGGLLRDGAEAIDQILGFVDSARRELPHLEAYIFENNSRDRTAELLEQGASERPYLKVRSETWDLDQFREAHKARTWDNKPCRLELIAETRNRLLDWMREAGFKAGDSVVIVDWDFLRPPPLDPLVRSIHEMPPGVDGLFANGIDQTGRYYDLYELRTREHPLGPELLGDRFWSSRRRRRALARAISPIEPPIPCFSAFGGLAVYGADALADCRYSPYPTPALHDYYRERFHTDPKNREIRYVRRARVEKVRKGALMGAQLFGDEFFYRNNSGFNFPVVAEHVSLHLEMRARGRGNFFIDPKLLYFSSH